MSTTAPSTTDTIDLADLARTTARGWRWLLGGLLGGALAALLVIMLAPRRFDGSASAIIRLVPEAGGSLLSRLGDAGGGAAALLGAGGVNNPIETDIQILSSRSVLGAVVDSLALQVEVSSPVLPAVGIVRALRLRTAFKHVDVKVERSAPGRYAYTTDDAKGVVAPGGALSLPIGTITLREALPEKFTMRIFDRDEAILRASKNLSVAKAGGEVVRVAYRARDSLTAAAVPNAILIDYLARRKTDDRGANAHRAEFLTSQVDSTAILLAAAEESLRRFQERSGLVDATLIGKIELESASELRKTLGSLDAEQGALQQLLAQVASGRMTARQLLAYPSFLKSAGLNDMLRQLSELETERSKLLERRLETDDQVVALTRSITNIEGQMVPLASSYAGALQRQRQEVAGQLGRITGTLASFPREAQSSARLVREVLRLNQLALALQSQLVQARLSAISEGGDVRALDRATPPREPAFPAPKLTTALGIGVGLLVGLVAALIAGSHGKYLDGPVAVERLLGVPAVRFIPGVPLLMTGRETSRTIVLVPVDERAWTGSVAARLSDTARARGDEATIVDLSGDGDGTLSTANERIETAERTHAFVVVRTPGLTLDPTAAVLSQSRPVLLVAHAERVNRRALTAAADTLRRLNIPCAGVVLTEAPPLVTLNA